MTTPSRKAATGGHRYTVKSRTTEGFPLSRSEVERFCKRLRSIAEPIISHETWAATCFGAFIALAVAYYSLPDPDHHKVEHTRLGTLTVAALIAFVILASLAWAGRKRRKSDAWYVADDLEGICNERLGAKK